MTSDAKVGLLLGLVFIFIIAFLINGLPDFHRDVNNNELTTNMVSSQNNSPALAANERKVSREVADNIKPIKETPFAEAAGKSSEDNRGVYFTMPLPQTTSAVEKTDETNPAAAPLPLPSPVAEKTDTPKVESNRKAAPEIYIVREGDVLANIAKKFYGPVDGNKKENIDRIFEANSGVLKLPDEIYEGQKLIIPPLTASASDKNKLDSVFPTTMFKKVESIGQSHLPADNQQTKQAERYIVREGDTLWRIAAEQLGDGSRYGEIAKLNADVLDDEDSLAVGMRLKMPAR